MKHSEQSTKKRQLLTRAWLNQNITNEKLSFDRGNNIKYVNSVVNNNNNKN